jgi:hypothetical protein
MPTNTAVETFVPTTNGNGNGHSPAEGTRLAEASVQQIYAELLTRIGEDPTRDGLLSTPKRDGEVLRRFLPAAISQSIEAGASRRALRRGLRRDGDRQGHRILFACASTT